MWCELVLGTGVEGFLLLGLDRLVRIKYLCMHTQTSIPQSTSFTHSLERTPLFTYAHTHSLAHTLNFNGFIAVVKVFVFTWYTRVRIPIGAAKNTHFRLKYISLYEPNETYSLSVSNMFNFNHIRYSIITFYLGFPYILTVLSVF